MKKIIKNLSYILPIIVIVYDALLSAYNFLHHKLYAGIEFAAGAVLFGLLSWFFTYRALMTDIRNGLKVIRKIKTGHVYIILSITKTGPNSIDYAMDTNVPDPETIDKMLMSISKNQLDEAIGEKAVQQTYNILKDAK